MAKLELLHLHQRRIANIAISASSFRNQGKPKTIQATRQLLYSIDIKKFRSSLAEKKYDLYLDKQTNYFLKKLSPKYGVKWGTIRKGLNIFFRDLFYSSYIFEHLKLKEAYAAQLEIPLDSLTGIGILDLAGRENVLKMKWASIKNLTREQSDYLQSLANLVSVRKFGLKYKVDLDLVLWKKNEL